jgi:hypothetical protein
MANTDQDIEKQYVEAFLKFEYSNANCNTVQHFSWIFKRIWKINRKYLVSTPLNQTFVSCYNSGSFALIGLCEHTQNII